MRWREIIVGNIDEQWTSNVILMDHKMTRFELLGFKEPVYNPHPTGYW